MFTKYSIPIVFLLIMATTIPAAAQGTFIAEKGDAAAWSHIRVTLSGVTNFKTEDQKGWRNNGTGFKAVSIGKGRVSIKIDIIGKGGISYYDYTGSVTVKTSTNKVLLAEKHVISKDGGSKSFSTSWDPAAEPGNLTVVANISGGNPESFIYYVSGGIDIGEGAAAAVPATPVTQAEKPTAAKSVYKKDAVLITNVEGRASATLGKEVWTIDIGETSSAGTVIECGPGSAVSVLHLKQQIEFTAACPGRLIISEDGVTGDILKRANLPVQIPKRLDLAPRNLIDGTGRNAGRNWPGDYNAASFSVDADTSSWIISNGRVGLLEITQSGGSYSARMNVLGTGWETLDNVRVGSGTIDFDRKSASQHYWGKYAHGAITGTFSDKGGRTAPWEAVARNSDTKAGAKTPDPSAGSIAGNWKISFNGYLGVMELTAKEGKFDGRFALGGSAWEAMLELSVEGNSIKFRRAAADQRYTGTIANRSMSGTFTQGGAGNYPWSGNKTGN